MSNALTTLENAALTDTDILATIPADGAAKEQIATAIGLDTSLWNILLSGPYQFAFVTTINRMHCADLLSMRVVDGKWRYYLTAKARREMAVNR